MDDNKRREINARWQAKILELNARWLAEIDMAEYNRLAELESLYDKWDAEIKEGRIDDDKT